MKKFLQYKKGRYSFRQNKRGSRYPSKDFCKSSISFVHCLNPAVALEAVEHIISFQLRVYSWLYLAKASMSFCILHLSYLHFDISVQMWAFKCLYICQFTSFGCYLMPSCISYLIRNDQCSHWCALLFYCIITFQQDRLECAVSKKKIAGGTFVSQTN